MDTSRNRTCSEGNADDIDSIGLGCALEFFNEYDEVMGLINQLKEVYGDRSLSEKVTERFIYVLNQYQEQPHLLDRYLDDFLNHLLAIARDTKNDRTLHHMAFKFLYVITKVRGYKVVLRHLPHEVSDVEPVLSLLGEQDPKDAGTWETRYVLLLWMSIIVMIPFHMHRLDDLSDKRPLIDRIMDVIKLYLSVGDKARDAAAFLAAHFVSRPDVKEDHLREYLDWCMEMLMSGKEENRIGLQAGILSSLALLFKHGKRDDVEPHGAPVLRRILHCGFKDSASSIVRKMALKLIQRIGLSFLRVKVASWRYSRGKRSLADNLCMGDARPPEAEVEAASEEEDYDIPDETEDVVEQLLVGLRDKDTIIRWSAAKGVGRVTGRLPKELADDVVTSVLELFSLRESDSAWHGGCLALAELGRRGLILPQHLQKVVSVVVRALVYDEQRGNFSVGSHIRDAACYVCWSFARAYEPQVLEPYVRSIAGALLVTTVFDREITCRRAASAAFQENVGRQGTFPHGIEILTETDYYAVGSRTNSFLHLSVHIAQFSEYTRTLMDHLLEHKIKHWDPAVRELASKSLHNLTPSDAAYVTDAAVPLLLDVAVGMDLNGRHGAILSLGEVIHALALYHRGDDRTIEDILGPQVMGSIKSLVYTLEERGLFRGMGGILMRNAVCLLIEKCSLSALPFHKDQDLILKWQWMLDSCLRHMDGSVRAASVSALPPFCLQYLPPDSPRCHLLLAEYLEQLRATHMELRCGFALAVGALPEFVLRGRVEEVVRALGSCAEVTEEHPEWAEARRDAVRALARVARTVGVRGLGDPGALFESLLLATQDYTLDSRGEIGAIVREAAMLAIQVRCGVAGQGDGSRTVGGGPGVQDLLRPGTAVHGEDRQDQGRGRRRFPGAPAQRSRDPVRPAPRGAAGDLRDGHLRRAELGVPRRHVPPLRPPPGLPPLHPAPAPGTHRERGRAHGISGEVLKCRPDRVPVLPPIRRGVAAAHLRRPPLRPGGQPAERPHRHSLLQDDEPPAAIRGGAARPRVPRAAAGARLGGLPQVPGPPEDRGGRRPLLQPAALLGGLPDPLPQQAGRVPVPPLPPGEEGDRRQAVRGLPHVRPPGGGRGLGGARRDGLERIRGVAPAGPRPTLRGARTPAARPEEQVMLTPVPARSTDSGLPHWCIRSDHTVWSCTVEAFRPCHMIVNRPYHMVVHRPYHSVVHGPYHMVVHGPYHTVVHGPYHTVSR